jgi:dGTPase
LEVVQIARSLARVLRLNEDLSEAMALAHDLGHTPFGHSVEGVLDEWLKEEGGFEHNAQGLRCVDLLETPYADFPGLNLTYEVRSIFTKKASMALRRTGYASPLSKIRHGAGEAGSRGAAGRLAGMIAYNSTTWTMESSQDCSLRTTCLKRHSGRVWSVREDESVRRRGAIGNSSIGK